jgi:hypothetical protein
MIQWTINPGYQPVQRLSLPPITNLAL